MKRFRCIAFAVVLSLLAHVSTGQCVTTTLAGGTGQNGTMFDVSNISGGTVVITGFEQAWFSPGTSTVQIYTKTGSWSGAQANAAAWTLVATAPGVAHPVVGVLVPIPAPLAIAIPAGATQGFYITGQTTDTVAYTAGVNQLNAVIGTDGTIQVRAGIGVSYPFGVAFGLPTAGRLWNGKVCYGASIYETNSAGASLEFDGVSTLGYAPATLDRCSGAVINAEFASTLAGNGYEIIVSFAPLVPAGGGALVTGSGQIVNVDLSDPTTSFLFGLTFAPFPAPSFTIPFVIPGVPTVCAQLAVLGGSPDGFTLSQALQINDVGGLATQTIPGPVGDDVGNVFVAGTTYTDGACGSFVAPALPLYGVVQNTYHVITNGRITWPLEDTGFAPTVAAAQGANGMVGAWADFNTLVGGGVTCSLVGTAFVVNYNAIAYFLQPGTASTFSISIDSVSGVITLSGLGGIGVPTSSLAMILGASPGPGATNPGNAAFGPAGAGSAGLATDMIYVYGVSGPALAGGANTVVLTPDGANNYTWTSF